MINGYQIKIGDIFFISAHDCGKSQVFLVRFGLLSGHLLGKELPTRLTICSLCILTICNILVISRAAHSVDYMFSLYLTICNI